MDSRLARQLHRDREALPLETPIPSIQVSLDVRSLILQLVLEALDHILAVEGPRPGRRARQVGLIDDRVAEISPFGFRDAVLV